MHNKNAIFSIKGLVGKCGFLDVFLGFAPGNVLYSVSFADILDENSGEGYQRPCNREHSHNFREYITNPGTSTVPLTLNLRNSLKNNWEIKELEGQNAILNVKINEPCLAQVDCQHRLNDLIDVEIPLAFMTFIGLDLRKEMSLFYIINSKARGLSSSLTDFHQSNLINDILNEAPHLYLAKRLNEDPESPWFRQIKYGGQNTSGPKRRTSLRMMQRSINRLLNQVRKSVKGSVEDYYRLLIIYWKSIEKIFPEEWENHRHYLITKGLGVYSLTMLLGDIVRRKGDIDITHDEFCRILLPLKQNIDWGSNSMFSNVGGHKGAIEVYKILLKHIKI